MSTPLAIADNTIYFTDTIPSAFKVIEWPARRLHDKEMLIGRLSDCEKIGRSVVYPLILCLAPFTLVADIVIGVVEIIFAFYMNASKEVLYSIARKKLIASPIQHITFIVINATGCLLGATLIWAEYRGLPFLLCLPFSGWLANFTYGPSQTFIGKKLPEWTRPDGFNIFIDRGARGVNGEKYFESFDAAYESFKQQRRSQENTHSKHSSSSSRGTNKEAQAAAIWNEKCDIVIQDFHLTEVTGADLTRYDQLKNRVIKKLPPIKLLELEDNFTETNLKRAYKKGALILHPDKNYSRQEEAGALTQLFFEANCHLEEVLKDRN